MLAVVLLVPVTCICASRSKPVIAPPRKAVRRNLQYIERKRVDPSSKKISIAAIVALSAVKRDVLTEEAMCFVR
jgi:hypothetical protein